MSCRAAGALVAMAVVVAACSSGGGDAIVTSTAVVTSAAPSSTAATTTTLVASTTSSTLPATTTTTTTTATTAAPATTVVASAAPAAPDPSCVASLPLRRRIALVTWPGVYAARWPQALEVASTYGVGGVALMTADGDVRDRLAELEVAAGHDVVVATDEEGGDVQRLRAFGPLPSAEVMAAIGDPELARGRVADHARVLRDLGVDLVLGPVVDVAPAGGRSVLGDRLFGDDPDLVTTYGRAYLEGWRDGGLDGVLKHFPGHGAASADTHLAAATTPPIEALAGRDLRPYVALAPLGPAVMVGHLTVPGLTEDGVPASLSPRAIGYLRTELGYGDALVLTDSLEMRAVGRLAGVAEAAVLALAAGADVVLFVEAARTGEVIDAVEAAVADGRLPEARLTEAASRVARTMRDRTTLCPPT